MAGSLIVSIVYSAVPILAVLAGFIVVRRDYAGRQPSPASGASRGGTAPARAPRRES
ncbi:hypothetical protein [Brevibacterium album]|uniref:hypothetical protein n=1 Tax=Brevibacterium album TaxID=417948 RepID=UPI0004194CAC|nr:hypothetical protein [Brevibacterium album]